MPTLPLAVVPAVLGLLFAPPSFGEPAMVSIRGYQLLVAQRRADGSLAPAAPFVIRGVNWSPASTNTITSTTDPDNVLRRRPEFWKWHGTDLPLIRGLNANTVRVPMDFGTGPAEGPAGRAVLDACQANGLMAIMTIDNGIGDTNRIAEAVRFYRDHPAILLWSLGNEWNINRYYGAAATVEEAARRTEAAAILIKALDPNHPVAASYGEIDIPQPGLRLADTARYVNEVCPHVDVWGLNVYRGKSFGSLFTQWAGISSKPMFLGEFGIDAFHSSLATNPNPPGAIDEAEQAEWDAALWRNLARHLSANDPGQVAIGGLVHEFNDQWWKVAPAGSQQTGGLISATGFPDGMASEEMFGLCDIHRRPRAAWHALREAFDPSGAPPGRTLAVSSTANSGVGSLRQAVAEARAGDTIVFAFPAAASITFGSEIRITNDLTILGPGADRLTFNGNGATRFLTISKSVSVRIAGVTFTRGSTAEMGGAINNRGALELSGCRFANNFAGSSGDGSGQGGAIHSTGSLTAERCVFADNRSSGNGGAIRSAGDLSLQFCHLGGNHANYFGGAVFNFESGIVAGSVLTNNSAGPAGGGIWNENSGLTVTDSTLARNSAQEGGGLANKNGSVLASRSTFSLNGATKNGGGIFNGVFGGSGGTLVLANCTVVSNSAPGATAGGGLRAGAGSVTLRASLVARNRPADISGAVVSGGFNLLGNAAGSSGVSHGAGADLAGGPGAELDPQTGPLRDNGGPTPTHALARGSPALDAGNGFGREYDARGERRFDWPEIANALSGDGADIGAYEAGQPRIQAARAVSGLLTIEFTTVLGADWRLETSPALPGATWLPNGPVVGDGGLGIARIPMAGPNAFFRIAVP